MAYIDLQTATIAINTALSAEVLLGEKTLVGIVMPAGWDAASITFQGTVDDTNFGNLFNDAGTEVTITTPAATQQIMFRQDLVAILRGVTGIKIRSGTNGTPVNQTAARAITLITRTIY